MLQVYLNVKLGCHWGRTTGYLGYVVGQELLLCILRDTGMIDLSRRRHAMELVNDCEGGSRVGFILADIAGFSCPNQ